MNINMIKTLAEQRRYDESLAACDELLNNNEVDTVEILKVRAYVLALSGNYERALQDREEILNLSGGSLQDFFLAADNAISLKEFNKAVRWLKEVLRLGEEQKETWFASSALFLLAYAQLELGHYEKAMIHLKEATAIEPKCAYPLPDHGMWDNNQLMKEIRRRARIHD